MKIGRRPPIHKIFIEYLVLKEINEAPTGISGYEIKRKVNHLFDIEKKESEQFSQLKLSQSLVYRVIDRFKSNDFIDEKETVINNRYQKLYRINENGKKRLDFLIKVINHLTPSKLDEQELIKNFFSGKILPFELVPENYPKDKLLKDLIQWREHLKFVLKKMDEKIDELKKELLIKK